LEMCSVILTSAVMIMFNLRRSRVDVYLSSGVSSSRRKIVSSCLRYPHI